MSGPQKTALVTGAAEGLGAAILANLKGQGARVVAIDRQIVADADKMLRMDLSMRERRDALAEKLARDAPYDLVVLNAGISATGHFETIPLDAHHRVLEVNALAAIEIATIVAPMMAENGRLVLVSSLSHRVGYPGAASYAASKDALAVFGRSMRRVLKRRRISVTIACPGPLRTEHAARHAPDGAKAETRMAPDVAARMILADADRRKRWSVPGFGNRVMFTLGGLAPNIATRAMKRLVFDRLTRDSH